jgi:hypothetical protein
MDRFCIKLVPFSIVSHFHCLGQTHQLTVESVNLRNVFLVQAPGPYAIKIMDFNFRKMDKVCIKLVPFSIVSHFHHLGQTHYLTMESVNIESVMLF